MRESHQKNSNPNIATKVFFCYTDASVSVVAPHRFSGCSAPRHRRFFRHKNKIHEASNDCGFRQYRTRNTVCNGV